MITSSRDIRKLYHSINNFKDKHSKKNLSSQSKWYSGSKVNWLLVCWNILDEFK